MEKTIFAKFSNLKWWQAIIMICSILISGGFAAYMGANVSFNMNIEWRIQELEQRQNATELLLSTEINSSVSALSKSCSYLISTVGSYIVMQRGNDSKAEYWSTNFTKVEEFAVGNLSSGGSIYLKGIQWNSTIFKPSNVVIFEEYSGSWMPMGMIIWSGTSFPSNPVEGLPFYRTDLHTIFIYNASQWNGWMPISTGTTPQNVTGAIGANAIYMWTNYVQDAAMDNATIDTILTKYQSYDITTVLVAVCALKANGQAVDNVNFNFDSGDQTRFAIFCQRAHLKNLKVYGWIWDAAHMQIDSITDFQYTSSTTKANARGICNTILNYSDGVMTDIESHTADWSISTWVTFHNHLSEGQETKFWITLTWASGPDYPWSEVQYMASNLDCDLITYMHYYNYPAIAESPALFISRVNDLVTQAGAKKYAPTLHEMSLDAYDPNYLLYVFEHSVNYQACHGVIVYLGDLNAAQWATWDTSSLPEYFANITTGQGSSSIMLLDSYNAANRDTSLKLQNTHPSDIGWNSAMAQSFNCTQNSSLSVVSFYLRKTGSPDAVLGAGIYAHTGSFGSGTPTGNSLETSITTLQATTLTLDYVLYNFTFSESINLVANTSYCICIYVVSEVVLDDVTNYVNVGTDSSTPSHAGNLANYANSQWYAQTGYDCVFYLYVR